MGHEKAKVAFFSKGDNKFICDILDNLSEQVESKLIIISSTQHYKLIDQWMSWADACWFEWCDDLIAYGSKLGLASQKKIICRLHSYEAFTNYPSLVNWGNVDKLIFVSKDIQKYVIENFAINKEITTVIPNGLDIEKFVFSQRNPGFNIAYVGYINYKKGPMLLLHTFKAIYDTDARYRLYIAGRYQDPRYQLYFKQMVEELGLVNNFFFEGWQQDIDKWLENKDYIICSSVLESQNMSIMQAMAKGIKPVIHNFAGAKGIYPEKYIWNTIGDAVSMITDINYNSEEYRAFIRNNYALEKNTHDINNLFDELIQSSKAESLKNSQNTNQEYREYVRCQMTEFIPYTVEDFNRFDFESAQIMLGKRDRTVNSHEMIEFILRDNKSNLLILNNIWINETKNEFILPKQMENSINSNKIISLCKEVLTYDIQFEYNIGGFVWDTSIKEDINKNYLAYIWERGIPASQFLPINVYMKIVERYIFAAGFISKDSIVLEAPCGFGYGAAYLSKKCRHVEALDIAEDNIIFSRQAYRQSNINWKTGDVTALPYADNVFDTYISFEVFEHIPADIVIRHIEEAYRVIRKGGRLIISTPNGEMRKNVHNPFHTKEYNYMEFKSVLLKVFDTVEFYSMVGLSIEKGINEKANVMIAICVRAMCTEGD
ncbi:MAG TPA: methyltransferase domain-containing protein [Ruminiclostridium sp.]|nr:methyltransferase domain-containing protein [Ruminiclostridium sp.]